VSPSLKILNHPEANPVNFSELFQPLVNFSGKNSLTQIQAQSGFQAHQ
jgi:hypothetical protein